MMWRVSILVLMDLPFLHNGERSQSDRPGDVSILVLMDLPFLRYDKDDNAYFIKKFQSLFLWIFRSYEDDVSYEFKKEFMFQSLFLWIFRSYLT